ncbi:fluoride efflux transporter FluC [Microbacterium karelineae]|uniref:fluoride efflux transporter FluC n=1 Tax=Microbacterium karelineae TaxID=2654283 RepID=UPI0012E9D137|nr:CrcB family protein [Microbacterium karelineae]
MTAARPRIDWRQLPLVVAGGALGALLRWALTFDDSGVVSILIVNVVGSALLGVVVGMLGDRHPLRRAFLGTGLLGGFTSYSALAPSLGYFAMYWAGPAAWFGLAGAGVLLLVAVAAVACALAGLALGGVIERRRAS